MKSFLLKILLPLSICVGVFLIAGEALLRRLPNDIRYKSEWMDENCHRVKILVLGSSSVSMGIKPSVFSLQPSFNCGMGGQEPYEDYAIFKRYINRMDSLKYLIIDYQPFAYCCGANTDSYYKHPNNNPMRTKYYSIHYGIPRDGLENRFLIASGVSDILRNIMVNRANGNGSFLSIDSDGYQGHYFVEMPEDKQLWNNTGKRSARRSHLHHPLHRDEAGLSHLEEMISLCKAKGVTVALVTCPTHPYYYQYLDSTVTAFSSNIAKELALRHKNVVYLDYLRCRDFSHKDMSNPNHLNGQGSIKFTQMLNERIVDGLSEDSENSEDLENMEEME